MEDYLKKITPLILKVLTRKTNETIMSDILLDLIIDKYKKQCKYVKQLQMKVGEIWQIIIGEFEGYENLKVGHVSKMDIFHKETNTYIELKNRYNTDNSSSKTTKFNQMAHLMKKDPTIKCIYGIINDKNQKGSVKKIDHKGFEIVVYSGDELLKHIFGKKYMDIIKHVAEILRKHISDLV